MGSISVLSTDHLGNLTEKKVSESDDLDVALPSGSLVILGRDTDWAVAAITRLFPDSEIIGWEPMCSSSDQLRAPIVESGEFSFTIDHVSLQEGNSHSKEIRRIRIDEQYRILLHRVTACFLKNGPQGRTLSVLSAPKVPNFTNIISAFYWSDNRRWTRLVQQEHWIFSDILALLSDWTAIFMVLSDRLVQVVHQLDGSPINLKETQRLHSLVGVSIELGEVLRIQTAIARAMAVSMVDKPSQLNQPRACQRRLEQISANLDYNQHTIGVIKQQFENLNNLMFNTAAAQQSQTLGYISMLGFFFVPLTFVASIFGMTDLHVNPLWYLCGGGPFILASIIFLVVTKHRRRRRNQPQRHIRTGGLASASPQLTPSITSAASSIEVSQLEPPNIGISPGSSPRIMTTVLADPPQQFIFKDDSYDLQSAGISSLLGSPPSHPPPASPVRIPRPHASIARLMMGAGSDETLTEMPALKAE